MTFPVRQRDVNRVILVGEGRFSDVMIQEVIVIFMDGRWQRLDALTGIISRGARKEVAIDNGGRGDQGRPGNHGGPGGPKDPEYDNFMAPIREIRITGYNQDPRSMGQIEVLVGSNRGGGHNPPPPPPRH